MIYSAIDAGGQKFRTYLSEVFEAIQNRQLQYNWLITDCECYPQNLQAREMLDHAYCWLTGEELTALVQAENPQWIWAVLSGFDKQISLSEVIAYPLPYANGYTGFWKNPSTMQHPLADIEIVAWDSVYTLLFSKDNALVKQFNLAIPSAKDLADFIAD